MRAHRTSLVACLAVSLSFVLSACGDDAPSDGTAAKAGSGDSGGRGGRSGGAGGKQGMSGGSSGDAGQATGGVDDGGTGGRSAAGRSAGGESGDGSGNRAGTDNDGGSDNAGVGGEVGGDGGSNSGMRFCGNGTVEVDEECEGLVGCAPGERCTAQCACTPAASVPPSSQLLIEQALRAGTIDYPTSLLYRVWALFHAPELPAAYDGDGSEGEDTYLFLELSRVRSTLPAEIETDIAPYLVRPDDPTSIFSQPPLVARRSGTASAELAAAAAPAPVGCAENDVGQPDWRAHETTNFVVWSCGGGVGGTDRYAAGRVIAGTIAEEVWAAMAGPFAQPLPDNYPVGPGRQSRTDIYILETNQCRLRGGFCTPIPNHTLAAAAPATPCLRGGGGPLVSSAYLVVGADQVPVTGGDAAAKFRYIMAHEFFHAASYGVNFEAQGGTCGESGPDLPPDELRSWLTEASAEWSSFAFFQEDDPDRRTELFRRYQIVRDASQDGLHATLGSLPYQAFLYPLFVQEENGEDPQKMLDFWKTSQGARNQVDLDNHLNATFGFADHFRDFAERNFNRDLPGDPVMTPHSAYDPALPFDAPMRSFVPEPALEIIAPLEMRLPLRIAPLAAETHHYYLKDNVRSVRIDATDVPNMEHLSLDAIVKVGDSWRRERLPGPIYEFCRSDEDDDISELYLIFSNFDHTRGGRVDGDYRIQSRTFCPGGWSGTIHARSIVSETVDESDAAGHTVTDDYKQEDHYWTVTSTALNGPPNAPPGFENERLQTHWHAVHSNSAQTTFTDERCTSVFTENASGSGSGTTFFDTFALGPGTFSLTPIDVGKQFAIDGTSSASTCDGATSNPTDETGVEAISYILGTPAFASMAEAPEGSGHFKGSYVIAHDEQPRTGGVAIVDVTVEWDLTRVEER